MLLKPHLDSQSGEWRAFINPPDAATWFTNYADIGGQQGALVLCIGAELVSMSTNAAYDGRWRSLIAGVRQRFTGGLTYSANWGDSGFNEEYPHIPFWDALNYLGISACFQLADDNSPTVASMNARLQGYMQNRIIPFQQRWNKPVLFTEVGYRSTDYAAEQPWNNSAPNGLNTQQQADCYEAFFESWANVPWFAGAEFWGQDISVETVSADTAGMLEEARRFAAWHPAVVVKVPSTPDGWAVVKQLKDEGIRTNVTLCFSVSQALFAALAGAYIISPFVGRLDDIAVDGMQVVRDTVEIYR